MTSMEFTRQLHDRLYRRLYAPRDWWAYDRFYSRVYLRLRKIEVWR